MHWKVDRGPIRETGHRTGDVQFERVLLQIIRKIIDNIAFQARFNPFTELRILGRRFRAILDADDT
jgi:hypothetical protein